MELPDMLLEVQGRVALRLHRTSVYTGGDLSSLIRRSPTGNPLVAANCIDVIVAAAIKKSA